MYIFNISLFGIQIAPTWYGLMYALGFIICYQYVKKLSKIKVQHMDTLLFYIFLGVILGWRLGYVILYNPVYFLSHPLSIPMTWQWGMSFHGGALGVIIAMFLFAKKYKYQIFQVSDPIVTILPVALGLWRLGNYINQELPGYTPYNWPLAINKLGVQYFPSPLLEGFLEWFILLILLLIYKHGIEKDNYHSWVSSGLFLLGYWCLRIIAEFFRLPDWHIWYLMGTHWITLGMIYTIPMILIGVVILIVQGNRNSLQKTNK